MSKRLRYTVRGDLEICALQLEAYACDSVRSPNSGYASVYRSMPQDLRHANAEAMVGIVAGLVEDRRTIQPLGAGVPSVRRCCGCLFQSSFLLRHCSSGTPLLLLF